MTDAPPRWARPRASGEAPLVTLGTMNFGKRTPSAEAERIVHRALERGVRLFDTANAYVDGESERLLGRALRDAGEDVAIATKVGFGRIAGRPEGLAPERIRAALDESLTRLGVERIALYYLHVPDHATPIERSLEAIGEALASGKVGRFGVSNYASWQILEIRARCEAMGIARPVIAQQLYNLLIRQLDLEYFRFARHDRLHTTVYNPLAGGLLTGRYRPGDAIARGSRFDRNRLYQGRYWSEPMLTLAAEFEVIARDAGMGLTELAYAWLAGHPSVDSILVGPATLAQLDQALDAVTLVVPDDVRARVDAAHVRYLGTEASYAR
jgi:aryl-alcohol dehydrogenase-like predicted oxidoreductase